VKTDSFLLPRNILGLLAMARHPLHAIIHDVHHRKEHGMGVASFASREVRALFETGSDLFEVIAREIEVFKFRPLRGCVSLPRSSLVRDPE
jgi:hypothetical protein